MLLCGQLASSLTLLQPKEAESVAISPPAKAAPPVGKTVLVRRFVQDDSVFFDDDYLIKGVAGLLRRAARSMSGPPSLASEGAGEGWGGGM
jgi:hypothetical protein